MKNFYYLTLLIFLLSCNSEFKDKSQARNEVNKQGFRDGRWVDYLDESGVLISDTNNNNSYLLSEYKDGNPINKFKEYYKSGVLKSEGEFLHDSIKYDKNTTPKDYINRINVYDMGGKPMQIINYSNTGIILNELFKAKDDSLSVIYQYYNQNIRENFKNIKLVGKSFETNIDFTVNSWFTDTSKYTIKVQNKISKDMKEGFSNFGKDKDYKLFYNKLVDLFTKKGFQLFIDNLIMKRLPDGKETNISISKVFRESYNISSSRGSSETSTNGTSNESSGGSNRLSEAQVCDNLIAYKDRSVVISGFYSSSQSENQGWSLRSRNDFNEEQLNSSMTFQFYEENESFYTRVIFVGDCPIILRIPRELSSVPNINGNYITVQGLVIGRNKIKVSSLSR